VADWDYDDYESAARDGDPQLQAALTRFGERFADDKEHAAQCLANLLDIFAAKAQADGGPRPVAIAPGATPFSATAKKTQLVAAIVAALGDNGTSRARQVLEDIVLGKRKTADQQKVAVAALKALTARRGAATDDLLYRVIVAQERPDEDDSPSPSQAKALDAALVAARAKGSDSLAVRLANWMTTTKVSKTLQDRLLAFLKEARPENLAAEIVLFQKNYPDQATQEYLERQITACGGGALLRLWGIQSPEPQNTALAKTIEKMNVYRLATRLWGDDVAAAFDRRLTRIKTLEGDAALVAMASTIPHPAVRTALQRTLETHWDETPKGLAFLRTTNTTGNTALQSLLNAGGGGHNATRGGGANVRGAVRGAYGEKLGITVEPGFVTLLKVLRRNDRPDPTKSQGAARANGHNAPSARLPKKLADALDAKKEREQIGEKWMDFSLAVTQSTCRRFLMAAQAREAADSDAALSADSLDLPFELHPKAQPTLAYRLDWPENISEKIGAAPLLKVRYVRIEQKAAPLTVFRYYRRKVPNGKEHLLADVGWIDGVVIDKERGLASSTDVLVAKANKSVVGPPDQEQEITVDILTIECEGIVRPSAASTDR
jgi:hypothetical protein